MHEFHDSCDQINGETILKDKDKITAVLDAFNVPYYWETDRVLMQGKRMYRFNGDGEVVQVTEEK